MSTAQRLELAKWVVTEARRHGADGVAANLTNSRQIVAEVREQQLDRLRESTTNSLSIELYAGGRYSSHTTNDLRRDALSKFLAETVAMTRYLTEDPYRDLPDPKYYEGQQSLDLALRDSSYEELSSDERVRIAMETEAAVRAASDSILTCSGAFADQLTEEVRVHSNGFEGTRQETEFSAWCEAVVRADGDARPADYAETTKRSWRDLAPPEELARDAVARALAKRGQKKLATGRFDLIVENRAASRIIGRLTGAMSGAAIQQKRSYLDGKLGQPIASEHLTLIDDPLIVGGFGSRLYDSQALATSRRVMIDRGVLKQYYIDPYYARKLETEPTVSSSTNTTFACGSRSLKEMVAGMKRGILVNGFIGGNTNTTTGDFSVGIVGMYIEDGQVVHPVNEMNIAGNLIPFFNQLVEMGNDPYPGAAMARPSMRFENIEFAGL